MDTYTTPGLDTGDAHRVAEQLQDRLVALLDLQLTLKHIHWNVVGPNFIGVHEMLDPQTMEVREFSDELAERIATLGGFPDGRPGTLVQTRDWDDYSLERDTVERHLGALDRVYAGVIGDHRKAIAAVADLDPISEDLLISQTSRLELFQWFVRAHLSSAAGEIPNADTEREAASQAEAA